MKVLVVMCLLLQGCVPVLFLGTAGIGATAATYAGRNENGLGGRISDSELTLSAKNALFKAGIDLRYLCVVIKNYEILVTGCASEQVKATIRSVLDNDKRFRKIYIETFETKLPIKQAATDNMLLTKINYKITFASGVFSLNYALSVSNGIVYIIGIAASQDEFDSVIDIIKNTPNVKKIISFVKIK